MTEQPALDLTNTGLPENRFEEMKADFLKYHREHPEVYRLFTTFTLQLIGRGFKHGAVATIIERIRWETAVNPVDPEKEFKIGNNHKPFYGRLFMHHYPQHKGFFRTRMMFSKEHAPIGKNFVPSDAREPLE